MTRRVGLVSRREYTTGRKRGFADWRPQTATRVVLEQVEEVLAAYEWPLTVRQVFYRLVGAYGYPKTESGYVKLCEHLNRARRAGLVPFEAIRDDGITARRETAFDDPGDFIDSVHYWADAYRRHRWQGQTRRLEVWVEAAGMVPQVERVAFPLGAEVYSSGGFESLTAKYDAAARINRRDLPTVVFMVGDLDASGLARMDSAAEDVTAFCTHHRPTWRHVAVTAEQVDRYDLVTAPGKSTDRAGGGMTATVQAEALAPDQLATEIRAALTEYVDPDHLAAVEDRSEHERRHLRRVVEALGEDWL